MTITITVTENIYDVSDLLDVLIELCDLARARNQRAMVKSLTFDEDTNQVEILVELREIELELFDEQPKKQAV